MADVKASDLSVRLKDYLGNTSVATAYLDFATGDTFAGAQTAIQTFLTNLDSVTGAVIEECFYKRAIPLPSVKSDATVGAPNSTALSLNFGNAQDQAAYAFVIPALDPVNIVSGGPDMVSGHTIDTLFAEMAAALSGTTGGHFTTNRDGNLNEKIQGRLVTRTHRKQLQGASKRPAA
jgi:hypothetical protein